MGGNAAKYVENSTCTGASSECEDCLTVNVVTPADATPDSNLPVVVVRQPVKRISIQVRNSDLFL